MFKRRQRQKPRMRKGVKRVIVDNDGSEVGEANVYEGHLVCLNIRVSEGKKSKEECNFSSRPYHSELLNVATNIQKEEYIVYRCATRQRLLSI